MTTPADYLRDHIYGAAAADDLAILAAIAGKSLCGLSMFATVDDTRGRYDEATPVYFFPVGDLNGETLGVHLRPDDVAAGRTALATLGEYGLIEVGVSVRATVIERLANYEADGGALFTAGLNIATEALGRDFYIPGGLGQLTDDSVREVVARAVGGSAEYYEASTAGRPNDVKRRVLADPATRASNALVLHARFAAACDELGHFDEAAEAAAAGLDCYHHTKYNAKLDKFHALAERLAQQRPDAFTGRHRTQLAARTDKARFELAADQYEHGDVAWGTKLLCDLCDDLGRYTTHPMGAVLRNHFAKLGWAWAVELCALRGEMAASS